MSSSQSPQIKNAAPLIHFFEDGRDQNSGVILLTSFAQRNAATLSGKSTSCSIMPYSNCDAMWHSQGMDTITPLGCMRSDVRRLRRIRMRLTD